MGVAGTETQAGTMHSRKADPREHVISNLLAVARAK
jgi:hypothetical protein